MDSASRIHVIFFHVNEFISIDLFLYIFWNVFICVCNVVTFLQTPVFKWTEVQSDIKTQP